MCRLGFLPQPNLIPILYEDAPNYSGINLCVGSRSWGRPRHLLMGETPKTAVAPQDRAASPLRLKKAAYLAQFHKETV
jgi:hypothetical protein